MKILIKLFILIVCFQIAFNQNVRGNESLDDSSFDSETFDVIIHPELLDFNSFGDSGIENNESSRASSDTGTGGGEWTEEEPVPVHSDIMALVLMSVFYSFVIIFRRDIKNLNKKISRM